MFNVKNEENKDKRFLLVHQESDSLFEVFNEEEARKFLNQGPCDDVTGVKEWEEQFRQNNTPFAINKEGNSI